MQAASTAADMLTAASQDLGRRLAVTWRHPRTHTYHAVGLLTHADHEYRFDYLAESAEVLGPRLLLGFPDLEREYRSFALFPLFAERLMDPARPDRPRLLEALSLDALATPMEVLARSGGRRTGDTLELLPEPEVAPDGTTGCLFLVHGIRHVDGSSDAIDALVRGQELLLVDEPTNPVNPMAIRVEEHQAGLLGWVPDPLVDYVRHVRAFGDATLRVERANPADVGHHLRLLVHLTGGVEPGYEPFGGPGWRVASQPGSGVAPVLAI